MFRVTSAINVRPTCCAQSMKLNTRAAQAISEGLQRNTSLKELNLNSNEIGDQGGEAWWKPSSLCCIHTDKGTRVSDGCLYKEVYIFCLDSFLLVTCYHPAEFYLGGLGEGTPNKYNAQSPAYRAEQDRGPGLQGKKIGMCKRHPTPLASLKRPRTGP